MMRDLRTLIYLLNLELRTRRMFENIGLESSWGCKWMHAIGEQQSKRMQSGSSNRSGRDQEQQLKRTQAASVQQQLKRVQSRSTAGSGRKREQRLKRCNQAREQQLTASGEQQLKRTQLGGQADAIGEQQLCTKSCPAPDYSQ